MKTIKRIAAGLCALAFSVSCYGSVSVGAEDIIIGSTEEPILLASEGSVTINETTFPDAKFRHYVMNNINLDHDGVLSQTERESVLEMTLTNMGISDLTGIGYFPFITKLHCEYNDLTSLDVSSNTKLTNLYCYGNELETLNVSGCSDLTILECWTNKLSSLDLTSNTKLTDLYCLNNSLTSLDLSSNTALKNIKCSNNQLESLTLGNNTALEKLYCSENKLTSLDIGSNTNLTNLECNKNQLTSLNTSQNADLSELYCEENQLTSLDLSNNTDLTWLWCSNNQLTSLDLSKNTMLSHLECNSNNLTSLDLSKHRFLTWLECDYNPLTSINLHSAASLTLLSCNTIRYPIGDVVNSYPLSNLPTGFDPDKASNWEGAEYDSETKSLKGFTSNIVTYTYSLGNGSSAEFKLQINSYKNPNAVELDEAAFPDDTFRQYLSDNFDKDHTGGLSKQELDSVTNIYLYEINHGEKPVADLTGIEHFKNLKSLDCSSGELTSLDLSKNTVLETLNCRSNQLAFLDLTANTALKTLNCGGNQLAFLDLTGNTDLKTLICDINSFCIGDVTESYSLLNLPAGFDPSKASDWTGAEYDAGTNSLKKFTSRTISYTYDCGNGFSKTFKLYADSVYFTPEAPVFTAVPSEDRIYLSWNTVSNAVKYKVSYRVKGTESWTEQETTAKDLNLTGLSAETSYEVIVTAYGGQLWSDYTDEDIQTVTTTAAVYPDLPVFTAEPSEFSITVNWSSVSTATKYRVSFREKGTSVWKDREVSASSDYSRELTSLTPGQSYEIVVTAYNGKHWSQYTDADILTVTTTALPKPLFTAVAGDEHSTIAVSWSSVENADNYEIDYRISGASDWSAMWTSGNKVTIENLKGGSLYDVAVKARINSVWSESDIVTVTPNAPLKVNVTATPGIKAVLLKWEPVEGATNYKVYCRKKNLSVWSSVYTTDTKYTVRSLNTDTEYEFVVTAYVDGEWTSYYDDYILTAVTRSTSDLKNPEFTVVPSLNQITVSWDSAVDAEKYKVYYRQKGYTNWLEKETAETSYTLSGIKSCEKYELVVSAYIDYTWTEFTDEDIKTASSLPIETPIVTAKAGVNSVTLSWNAVSGAEKYYVYYRKNGETSWHYESYTAETSFTMTGLMSDTAYEFYIQAKGSLESSNNSNTVTATPKKSILKAQAGLHSVTLTWDAVEGNTNYTVYYHSKDEDVWKSFETADIICTITDLEGGIPIVCKVVPQRFQYLDIKTDEVTVTPKAFDKPTVIAVPSETGVTLNWNAVGGAAYYNVLKRLSGAYSWDNPIKTNGTSYEFTGLKSGTKYDFAVLPCNDAYSDTWASTDEILTVKTGSNPPAKPEFTVTPNINKAALEWKPVNGAASYYLYYRLNGTEEWISESWGNNCFSRTFYGLTGGEKYDFLVRTCSDDSLLSEFTDSDIVTVTILSEGSENPEPEPDDPITAFVERLYLNILNRPSDPSKVTHIGNLNIGESACKVAYDFVFSSEFANLPISNEERVRIMYLTFLDREADPAGLADWTAVLDNGCSIGHIFYGFTQSDEFTKICNEYGINRGTWDYTENRDRSSKLTAFVSRLYTKAMGRNYDVNGLNDHTGSYLENHDLYQLAYNFIFSQEFIDKNLSDEDFVDVMYRTFFDREADPAGKADWLDRMANQGYTREDVLAGFVGSQECADLVAKFGI